MDEIERKTMQDIKDYVKSLDTPENEVYQKNSLLIMACFSKAIEFIEQNAKLRQPLVSGQLPTNEEIDLIIEQDLPFSEEYQKYSEKEKTLMLAATKAGAKWFRSSLIEGNFR